MSLLLSMMACSSNPWAYTETQLEADGVHVRLGLVDVDSVEIAGKSMKDGESAVFPLSLFHIGENELPIQGEGLQGKTLYFKLSPSQALQLSCTGEGSGHISIRSEAGGVQASGCAMAAGGYVSGNLTALNGAEILVGGQAVKGPLLLDARSGLWEQPLVPFKEGAAYQTYETHELPILVRHPDGAEWSGVVEYQDRKGDLMAAFLEGFPESTQGMPAGQEVALRWGLGWYYTGEGTLGEVARFARVVEESKPRYITSCRYVDRGAGQVKIDTVAVDRTLVVVDREGRELGRKLFRAKTQGYQCSDVQYEGAKQSVILPDHQEILDWAKALN